MLNPTTWNLFTLALTGRAAETAPSDLRLLAAAGDEARNDYLRGLGAIGNIIFWACENENYTDHRSDMRALGAFLKHTTDMALAADFFAGYVEALADDAGFDSNATAAVPLPEKGAGSELDVYSEILNGGKRA
ncbi:hypothetical protein Q2T70_09695 [Klebsiella oxytoca]|uniref:hypothetical protein n=1 Tax=Klebsiella oxytoca TaxID=571 RepID=UPI00265E6BBB|nr:hypothetical protein [Klebsiella oxytoca]WKM73964.1 hypothetical protein Q2T70_09695 [Klebsiella oxytoca]